MDKARRQEDALEKSFHFMLSTIPKKHKAFIPLLRDDACVWWAPWPRVRAITIKS